MFNRIFLFCVSALFCFAPELGSVRAGSITLDFEGVPTTYYHMFGNQNLGSHYAGLDKGPIFGTGAKILDRVLGGYNNQDFPPKSGNAVLFSLNDSTIGVNFSVGNVSSVGFWYTTGFGLTLSVFDSGNSLLGSNTGTSNKGTNSFLTFNAGSDIISRITITGVPNQYTIDDFTYTFTSPGGNPTVPEPSTLAVFGLGSCFATIASSRRRRRKSAQEEAVSGTDENQIAAVK